MPRSSPVSVRLEQPGRSVGEVMSKIRSWLDSQNIRPTAFRTHNTRSGSVAFDIRFESEHEASLFEQTFYPDLPWSGNRAIAKYQSTKLEALGQLAHDFDNLLTVLSGQLQLIKSCSNENRIIALVEGGLGSVSRKEKLVQHLMAFARQQPLRQEVSGLGKILPEIVEVLTRAFPRIMLTMEMSDEVWPVSVDPNRLKSAILNLTFNSRDAMSGSGALTIAAKNIHLEKPLENGLRGDLVSISVTDTATGMPEHAFEAFFTTKQVGSGTGLGLSMVRDFAEQSGGTATIEIGLGKGTSITIYLPRVEHPRQGAANDQMR